MPALFLFDNGTGHELNRFRVDLILFDPEGVYAKQLLLDMAPLSDDKKVLASFLLAEQKPCSRSAASWSTACRVRNGAGAQLDCVALLKVESRTDVPWRNSAATSVRRTASAGMARSARPGAPAAALRPRAGARPACRRPRHALAVARGLLVRRDDPARPGSVSASGANASLAGRSAWDGSGSCRRSRVPPPAGGREPRVVLEVEMHAVQNRQAACARGQQAEAERGQQRQA